MRRGFFSWMGGGSPDHLAVGGSHLLPCPSTDSNSGLHILIMYRPHWAAAQGGLYIMRVCANPQDKQGSRWRQGSARGKFVRFKREILAF